MRKDTYHIQNHEKSIKELTKSIDKLNETLNKISITLENTHQKDVIEIKSDKVDFNPEQEYFAEIFLAECDCKSYEESSRTLWRYMQTRLQCTFPKIFPRTDNHLLHRSKEELIIAKHAVSEAESSTSISTYTSFPTIIALMLSVLAIVFGALDKCDVLLVMVFFFAMATWAMIYITCKRRDVMEKKVISMAWLVKKEKILKFYEKNHDEEDTK